MVSEQEVEIGRDHEVPDRQNRDGVVFIGYNEIHALLNLPPDVEVTWVGATSTVRGIRIGLRSDRFDPVPEGAEAPVVGTTRVIRTDDIAGNVYIRFQVHVDDQHRMSDTQIVPTQES